MEQHERDLDRIDAMLEDARELADRIAYFGTDEASFV